MTFSKILNHFPPPLFLEIPFAGVSITDASIRCILFKKKGDTVYIDKYSEKFLEKGSVVGGQIKNKPSVVKLLLELKNELSLEYVKMSLPEESAYLFTAKIPIVKEEEVRGVIESKIEENVPVPPSELIFDYKLIDHSAKGHLDVVVSALPVSVLDNYIQIANESGLTLLSLEIESQAIARAVMLKGKDNTVLLVHFGPEKVGLYVVSFGLVHFTSTVVTKITSEGELQSLLQEIKKLYTYWHTLKENVDKPERKISEVIVCGSDLPENITEYLSQHLDVPSAIGNPWINIFNFEEVVPEVSKEDSLRFADAIGLALPSETLI
ncbi:MAG: pilus assembly protein PilM [Patescibacteria group bacterium]